MTMTLDILRAGPACTVQDAGRHGFLRFGVTPAGPMDWIAHRTANILAGNAPDAAVIEIGPGGLALSASGGAVRLGVVARGFRVARDGNALTSTASLVLRAGQRLDITPGTSGMWAYVAAEGGFDLAPVLGSLSTHLRSGIGPLGALLAGQRLPLLRSASDTTEHGLFDTDAATDGPVRFVPGPQDDRFAPEVLAAFCSAEYRISPRSDRMAYRLSGPPLVAAGGHDIVSDGIPLGAIQVPADGLPFVLMADRQPTGGYAKVGTVIRADLPRLAQMRPGRSFRFAPVSVEAAVAALRAAVPDAGRLRARLREIRMWPAPGA